MRIPDKAALAFSTCFGAGYLPVPGTSASLIGLALLYLLRGSLPAQAFAAILLIGAGVPAATKAERISGRKDPGFVVIDEVAGMLVSFLWVPALDARALCLGFFLFRVLDVFKPYPAASLQRLPGGAGIMADDLVAGVYANLMLQAATRLLP